MAATNAENACDDGMRVGRKRSMRSFFTRVPSSEWLGIDEGLRHLELSFRVDLTLSHACPELRPFGDPIAIHSLATCLPQGTLGIFEI
jgi:hypothetical protein